MKLLFDENLSFKLSRQLNERLPEAPVSGVCRPARGNCTRSSAAMLLVSEIRD